MGSTHRSWQTKLQQPILNHVDAGIWLPGPEDVVPLPKTLENHVPAELQEERLLKVTQHPVGGAVREGGGGPSSPGPCRDLGTSRP